jgi:hypothetical protein
MPPAADLDSLGEAAHVAAMQGGAALLHQQRRQRLKQVLCGPVLRDGERRPAGQLLRLEVTPRLRLGHPRQRKAVPLHLRQAGRG